MSVNDHAIRNRLLWILFIVLVIPRVGLSQSISFDESNVDTIYINNGLNYELALLKHNGDIAYIKDLQKNILLIRGSETTADWTVDFKQFGFVSSKEILDVFQNTFSYTWDDSNKELHLNYVPEQSANKQLSVSINIAFSLSSYFDMQLSLTNNWNDTIIRVDFPDNLSLVMAEGDSAVLPSRYPGMMLFPEFFKQQLIAFEYYPDYMQADYVSINKGASALSIYSLTEGLKTMHTGFGFFPESDPATGTNYIFVHEYTHWLENGESWTSPVSRFRIGERTIETLKAYRRDNKIDEFPSLETKLGAQFEEYANSPMHFYHYQLMNSMEEAHPFRELAGLVSQVTSPAIIMLTAYYTGGYHGHSPDYLPPDPRWGTPSEFGQMISEIKAQGKKIMLFTIPVWWNTQSPTMLNMDPEMIQEIARIDMEGNPYFTSYSDEVEQASGYMVSPSSPLVQNKMQILLDETFDHYGVDIFYDDVLGTAGFGYDFNKNAPTPIDYYQDWFEYLKADQPRSHMVEFAYDKMAKYALASMGHNRFDRLDTLRYTDHQPGRPVWHPYPALPVLYNDKMANYHWGSNPGYENTSYNIQFAVPMGIYIGFQEYGQPGGYWDRLTRDFQSDVISRLYGKQLIDYLMLPNQYTIADYGDIKVTKNWSFTDTLHLENYSLPPSGVLVESDDGSLVAGIFSGFNGADLSGYKEWEDHYIIQLSTDTLITIKHPYSKDTPIKIRRPSHWVKDDGIQIKYTSQEGTIGHISAELDDRSILFEMKARYDNETTTLFEISYTSTNGAGDPDMFYLYQNYPNPFNQQTSIEYFLTKETQVVLKIFNLQGQEIKTLVDQVHPAGSHKQNWDGTNDGGQQVSEGLYILKLESQETVLAKKMFKIK